ncbi:MAG: copper resistance protein CopC [Bauldia sp.]|nr:copper resistance protein CopC [Bauldia sp.]
MQRFFLVLVSLLAGLLATAGSALAHASLIATDPAQGAVLESAPANVTLTFNEPVSVTALRLIDTSGATTTLPLPEAASAILVPMPPDLPQGTHIVSWRVISTDGHPIGGSVVFSIGLVTGDATAVADTDPAVRTAIWVVRVALYLGLFVGAGGSFFLAWIGSLPAARRAVGGFLLLGLLAAPLALGLQGLDVIGYGLGSFLDGEAWRAALATTYGRTIIVAVLTLAAGLAAVLVPTAGAGRVLATIALGGVGFALSLSGHASSAPPQSLSSAAVSLHAVAIAFWVGSLLPLLLLLRSRKPHAAAALARFSTAIPYAIVPLIAAGLILIYVQLKQVSDLWTTPYGRVLLAKLVAVSGLFVLAALNRSRWTAPARRLEEGGTGALRRSIMAELTLVFVVFGLVALWRYTPPPRSLFAVADTAIEVQLEGPQAVADLTVTPGRVGPVSATVAVRAPDGAALAPKEVSLEISNPTAGIEPISADAALGEDGLWHVSGLRLPLGGEWSVKLDVLITDFERASLEGVLPVPAMTPSEALAAAGEADDGHGHTHGDINALNIDVNDPLQVVDAGPNPPSIDMAVDGAEDGGLDLSFALASFTFADEGEAEVHVPGRGHAHLYINGSYTDEFITDSYHLAPMEDGIYEIDAGLYALDHRAYVSEGQLISSRTTVRIASGAPIDAAAARAIDVELTSVPPGEVRTERVRLGETVALNWTASEPLALHLHGFDIEASVAPSSPLTMLFNANIPGRFPVETHTDTEVVVFYLEVYP